MVARISKKLIYDVRKHEKLLKDVSNPSKRNSALKKANRLQVGGSLNSTIKRLFSSVLKGKLPAPTLSSKLMNYMKQFVRSRNPESKHYHSTKWIRHLHRPCLDYSHSFAVSFIIVQKETKVKYVEKLL